MRLVVEHLIPALGRQSSADLLSLSLAWSTKRILGHPGLHRKPILNKINKTKQKRTKSEKSKEKEKKNINKTKKWFLEKISKNKKIGL